MRRVRLSLFVALVLCATSAAAQAPTSVGFRGYVFCDTNVLAAKKTFDAVVGRSRVLGLGGGVDVTRLWKGIFARVAFSSIEEEGRRVFVFNDEVFKLDIPLTIELSPLEIGAGWRLSNRALGRFEPYGGAGLLRMRYREVSDFAEPGDGIDETLLGQVVFGGIDLNLGKGVTVGAEVQRRFFRDALGDNGVAGAFEEKDLGGTTFRVVVGYSR